MKGHTVEKMWDVTPATDEQTMEDRAELAITSLYIPTYEPGPIFRSWDHSTKSFMGPN